MIRRLLLVLTVSLPLLAGCSSSSGGGDGGSAGESATSTAGNLDELAERDPRLSRITTPPDATGPVLGEERGVEVRVIDPDAYCPGYERFAEYRDSLLELLATADDAAEVNAFIEANAGDAETAAGDLRLGLGGLSDLGSLPWQFVASSQEWTYGNLDVETMQERATARVATLQPFDAAAAEVC